MISRAVVLDPHPVEFFRPSVLTQSLKPNVAPIVREGRILSDTSMPRRDWSAFDAPIAERGYLSKRFRVVVVA